MNAYMSGLARRVTGSLLCALALGIGMADHAQAQAALLGPGAAYLGIGASGITTGALDDRLAARGYPTFGSTATALNLGAYRIFSSGVMLGAEWHGLIIGNGVHEGRDVGIGGGYGTLGIGYVVNLSRRARVYPRIGLGGGGMGLWIERDSVVAFDDVLADPRADYKRSPVLSRAGPVVDIGAGVELIPGRGGSGPLLGLRFGYLAVPFDTDWYLYDHSVTGAPDATIAGAYIRVVFGVAWKR